MKKHEVIEKVLLGSAKSGNWGHKGAPGVGGSSAKGVGGGGKLVVHGSYVEMSSDLTFVGKVQLEIKENASEEDIRESLTATLPDFMDYVDSSSDILDLSILGYDQSANTVTARIAVEPSSAALDRWGNELKLEYPDMSLEDLRQNLPNPEELEGGRY